MDALKGLQAQQSSIFKRSELISLSLAHHSITISHILPTATWQILIETFLCNQLFFCVYVMLQCYGCYSIILYVVYLKNIIHMRNNCNTVTTVTGRCQDTSRWCIWSFMRKLRSCATCKRKSLWHIYASICAIGLSSQYRERDLNPHSHHWPKDFKSFVSTDSTIAAWNRVQRYNKKCNYARKMHKISYFLWNLHKIFGQLKKKHYLCSRFLKRTHVLVPCPSG